jgi:hypothetical protein
MHALFPPGAYKFHKLIRLHRRATMQANAPENEDTGLPARSLYGLVMLV